MKIAVTSKGETMEADVDPRFGRAKLFLVIETEGDEVTVVDNLQNLSAAHGAGIQAAQHIAAQGVEAILTGHVGPNAFRTLTAGGIKVYVGAQGSVREAVEKFKAGELKQASNPDVLGHWA